MQCPFTRASTGAATRLRCCRHSEAPVKKAAVLNRSRLDLVALTPSARPGGEKARLPSPPDSASKTSRIICSRCESLPAMMRSAPSSAQPVRFAAARLCGLWPKYESTPSQAAHDQLINPAAVIYASGGQGAPVTFAIRGHAARAGSRDDVSQARCSVAGMLHVDIDVQCSRRLCGRAMRRVVHSAAQRLL